VSTRETATDGIYATDPTGSAVGPSDEAATIEEVAPAPVSETSEIAADSAGPRRRSPFGVFRRTAGGIGAVGVKELRGRMRGRRAFVILSLYLVLLAGFAWMVELVMERTYSTGFGGSATFASAAIGQGIFVSILMLETLLVAFLAPMATAGAISLEREKQTLEMLSATPITSAAIVIGKLLSALIYVWLLIAASIPLTAVVFVFGGVAPDDVVHGYLVLVVTALGLGAFGLLCSSLVKRTQAASAITIFGVLALSIGSLFVILFWQALAGADQARGTGPVKGAPPAPLVFLNPFLAQADVAPTDALCGTRTALFYYCRFKETFLVGDTGIIFVNGSSTQPKIQIDVGGPVPAAIDRAPLALDPEQIKKLQIVANMNGRLAPNVAIDPAIAAVGAVPFEVVDAGIWQKSVVAWLLLSIAFLVLSVQFVSPTRRWRLRRGPRRSEQGPA
jgi:ABC-type transport system involved in multi-copper enzyme maturation permease subunit